jgi:TonB family protein
VSGRLFRAERPGVGPAVVGVLNPRIVAPADFETLYGAGERALILAHETAHLKAGDAAVNALVCAAQCLGWFNPLAHVAGRLLRVDQELACDAAVIGAFPRERKTYAELLLKTQLTTQPLPLGCHWPAGAEHPLKERIAMLKSPLPARSRRALGLACVAATSLAGAAAAWAAQPGAPGASAQAATLGVIPNNGHLEPAEANRLVGPGQTILCKPDENRELHNCRIAGTPFARIATAADVAREWPAQAKAKGLTGWVTLQCAANAPAGRLEACTGYHFGGAAERPEFKSAFEQAALRVAGVYGLKTNPGPDDAPLPKTPGFYTIEFNDHPRLPGGPPANPPVTRYPDFLPGPPTPAKVSANALSQVTAGKLQRVKAEATSVEAGPASAPVAPLVTQPDWAIKPTAADLADVYPSEALKAGLGGSATIGCAVAADGRLADCKLVTEAPEQAGFGEAAMKLSERFQMKPMSRDGHPVSGGYVRIPIRFLLPTPPAPQT